MRTKNFLALAATALIAYSGTVSAQTVAPEAIPAQAGPLRLVAELADPGCARLSAIKLTVKRYSIDLNDGRPVCVTVPGTFLVRIDRPKDVEELVKPRAVTARQKDQSESPRVTIEGDSVMLKNGLMLVVMVDADEPWNLKVGEEFGYFVDVTGVGTLDPRIRVIGGGGSEN